MPVYELVEKMPMSEYMGWILYQTEKLEQLRSSGGKSGGGLDLLSMDPANIGKMFGV